MVSLESTPHKSLHLPRPAKAPLEDGKSDGTTHIDHSYNPSTTRVQATR